LPAPSCAADTLGAAHSSEYPDRTPIPLFHTCVPAPVTRRLALECARTKGSIAVIGRTVDVSEAETEVAYAGTWTPMGSRIKDAKAGDLARGADAGLLGQSLPSACVLERILWTPRDPADPLAQRRVLRVTRMQLPTLHPELEDDWRQLRRHCQ